MVIELRERRVQVAVPRRLDAQAQIDVVEGDRQRLVEAADLFEHGSAHAQARGGDGRKRLGEARAAEVPVVPALPAQMRVCREARHQHQARMLDGVVGVPELGSDGADLGALRVRDQLGEPVRGDDLDVVVEEDQVIPPRLPRGFVVDAREIEREGIFEETDGPLVLQGMEICDRALLVAAIVYQNDFVRRVSGLVANAFDTLAHELLAVPGWNDDRNQRARLGQAVTYALDGHLGDGLDGRRDTHPLQMFLDGKPCPPGRVVFLAGTDRSAAGQHSPVIQDARDVADLRGLDTLDEAQRKVVILCTLEPLPEATDLPHDVRAVHPEVGNQVMRQEEVVVPVALEVRHDPQAVEIELVFVGVYERRFRMVVQLLHDPIKRVGRNDVVVVEERNELPGGEPERGIGGGADVPVHIAPRELDARVALSILLEHTTDMRRRRSVVRQAQLPTRVRLRDHRFDHGAKVRLRRVVHGRDETHERLPFQTGAFVGHRRQFVGRGRCVFPHPVGVSRLLRARVVGERPKCRVPKRPRPARE